MSDFRGFAAALWYTVQGSVSSVMFSISLSYLIIVAIGLVARWGGGSLHPENFNCSVNFYREGPT